MQVEELVVEKKEVEQELEHLKNAIKEGYISKRTSIARDLMAVYGHLQHGGKIIDLHKTFRDIGIDEEGHPKIAIVQYGSRYCYLYKKKSGGAIFSNENKTGWSIHANKTNGDIELPGDTFEWTEEQLEQGKRWKTIAPIIHSKDKEVEK